MKIAIPPSACSGFHFRQLEREDLQEWYEYLSDPPVLEHTSWKLSAPEDLRLSFDLIESTSPTSSIRLAIVDSANDRLIGSIGFHTVSDVNRSAEIAYDLSRRYWGQGIATAACQAVTEWAFANLGFVRIQATTLESNERSERVLLKCGYTYEGLLRAYRQVRGIPGNFKMFSRLNTD
jgi:RimJ/RimL family protein N-acetyltransferase